MRVKKVSIYIRLCDQPGRPFERLKVRNSRQCGKRDHYCLRPEDASAGRPSGTRGACWGEVPHRVAKLRKTGASRRYRAGELLDSLMRELGHEDLSTTQQYLSDVNPK